MFLRTAGLSLAALCLAAQAPRPALDVLPDKALGFILFRDPILSQVKLQGLMQRLKQKEDDPLTEAQKRFGLSRLPPGRQGMAIVFLEDGGANAKGPLQLAYLSPTDAKGYLESIKATSKDGKLWSYESQGHRFAAVVKEGWVILGPEGAKAQLRKAADTPSTLRHEAGSLGPWMEGGDAFGMVTTKGLWTVFHDAKKALGGAPQAEKADPFLAKAERELELIALQGRMDENGNLNVSLRARLNPKGEWVAMGRDLPLADAYGLGNLPKQGYMAAAGGSLPAEWIGTIGKLGTEPVLQQLQMQGVAPETLERFREQSAKAAAHLKDFSVLTPAEGGMMSMCVQFTVDDSGAYEADLKRLVEVTQEAYAAKKLAAPAFESHLEQGRHAFSITSGEEPGAKDMPPEIREMMAKQQPRPQYLALDGTHIQLRLGGGDGSPAQEQRLSEDEGIRGVADRLPREAHFFLFVDIRASMEAQAKMLKSMEERMSPEARKGLAPIPAIPPCPPIGANIHFDLDTWELNLALPAETQLAIGRSQEQMQKASNARMEILRKEMEQKAKERPPIPKPEGKEPAEDEED